MPSVPTHLPTREPRLSTHPWTLMLPSRPTHHPGVAWSRHCHVGSRPLGKSPPCFPQVAFVTWLLKPTGPQVGPQFLPLLPLPQGLSTPCRLYGNPRPSLQLRPPHSSGGGSFSRSRSVRRGPGLPSSVPAQPEPCVYLQVTLVHLLDWEGACVPPWAQHSSSVSPAGGRMGNPDSDPLQGCRCEMLKKEHRNGCVDADADGDEE